MQPSFAAAKPQNRALISTSGIFGMARRMGGANGSRECAPDDKLRDTHRSHFLELMGFAGVNPSLRTASTYALR
jgi:hypothetical protein